VLSFLGQLGAIWNVFGKKFPILFFGQNNVLNIELAGSLSCGSTVLNRTNWKELQLTAKIIEPL
jgi:hypothetical protein